MNLNQVTLPSQDVVQSISFYKKLGLILIVHTHDGYARFETPKGDATLSIHLVDELPMGPGVVVYFEVEDVVEKVLELKQKGIAFETETKEQTWLWTEASLRDPDGNKIIIYTAGENRKNPQWRIKD